MTEKGYCTRETVLNFLLDRYKTTYKDAEANRKCSNPEKVVELVEDCMEHFVDRDVSFKERVCWALDRFCDFYEAEAAYFVIYGRGRTIYLSSFFEKDAAGVAVLPTAEEFSLLLLNRLKNEMKPGKLCFLENVESLRNVNREVYDKLKHVGAKNEIFMPVFSYGRAVGFFTIYNIQGSIEGLSAVQKVVNVIATTGNEMEDTKFKNMDLTRRLVLEKNDNYKAIAEKKEEEVRFANAIAHRLGQQFKHTYVINLETGDYAEEYNKVFSRHNENAGREGAQHDFDRLVDGLKHTEFKNGLRRFLILSDLRLRLYERDETSFEYIDNDEHWCRCDFRAVNRDEQGNVKYALYTEEIIDREKQKCVEKMHFLRLVSDLYTAVYMLDLLSGELTTVKPLNLDTKFENYSGNLQMMMEIWKAEFFYPDASDGDRDFLNMDTLAFRLGSEGKISAELNTTKLGWINVDFVAYSKGSDGETKSVLWLIRRITDEKKYAALNEALAGQYRVLTYVSLIHHRFKNLIVSGKNEMFLPDEGDIETAIGLVRVNASDEYRDKVLAFVNLNDLDQRMGDSKEISVEYINNGGKWEQASIVEKARDDSGRISEIVFAVREIDDVKRQELEKEAAVEWAYEEAKQANATKTGFFSNLSHDIRTPMNAIVGMTRIALDNLDNIDRVEDCLGKIQSSSDHLLALINDSLDLSRIESGKVVIAHEPVNLRELQDNFMSIMQGYVVDRKLEIITDSQPFEVDYVLTDGLRLRQVVINILSNAIKYTPDGKNIIYRTSNKLSEDGKKLHIKYTIADSGIGMSQEFLKKIYEPFSQVERDGVHSNYKGTGLGMLIVKNFVDMLGGTIDIQSEVNVGTVVTLNFDFDVDPKPVRHKNGKNEAQRMDVDLKDVKVMLVEDNDINREIAAELLKSMNMVITEAVDGEDAVNKFRKSYIGEYKCIFMDIMMPLMNGYEATKAIRSMDRDDAKTVPIIAMTANAFMEDVKMSKDCGMNEHISKPIDPELVKEVIGKLLIK